jgi:hypothetical protein
MFPCREKRSGDHSVGLLTGATAIPGFITPSPGPQPRVDPASRTTATGSRSGASIEGDFWFVHTLRAKVVRLDMFASRAKAFECGGLNE